MTLSEKQRLFTKLLGQLIAWAYQNGFELTLGEGYRTPEQAKLNADKGIGIRNSLHCERLAVDLNLFVGGVYCPDSAAYARLGEYWKSLHPMCRFGGDFRKPDGNHFSFSPDGKRA